MVGMASFRHGDPIFVDYIVTAPVAAGDVIIVNDTPKVSHRDAAVADGSIGLAAIGGVYEMFADVAIPADKKVYWDPVNKWVTATPGTLKVFGVTTTATTGAGQTIMVRHDPGA